MTTISERPEVDVDTRLARLADASAKRIIDPDRDLPGTVRAGNVVPDELLSVADLDLDLSDDQRATLGREELASWLEMGSRFEAALNAGLSLLVLQTDDLTEPRVRFLLHEVGEETRHQRAFIRLIEQLQPQARNPFHRPALRYLERLVLPQLVGLPALFHILVMAGEEVPDVFQKYAAEHPDTDPYVATVNRYHRQEEARHLGYVRAVFPQTWASAGPLDRALVRHVAPRFLRHILKLLVHPGVYEVVGLPKWHTWRAANRTPSRQRMLTEAFQPILTMLLDAGAFRDGNVSRAWRELCTVDAHEVPHHEAVR